MNQGGQTAVHKVDFKLTFPPASFVASEPCDRKRFGVLLAEPSNFPSHVAKKVPMPVGKSMPTVIDIICR